MILANLFTTFTNTPLPILFVSGAGFLLGKTLPIVYGATLALNIETLGVALLLLSRTIEIAINGSIIPALSIGALTKPAAVATIVVATEYKLKPSLISAIVGLSSEVTSCPIHAN